jgi:hypothetical protein
MSDKSPKRITVSFEPSEFAEIAELAARNKVSKAWLVRRAVNEFVDVNKGKQLRLKFEPPNSD